MIALLPLLLACAPSGPRATAQPEVPVAPVAQPVPLPAAPPAPALTDGAFTELEPGLDLGAFVSPVPSPVGDSRVHVLRVDLARFALSLHLVSRDGGASRTGRQWADEAGLVAAINPSMFEQDHVTSTFLMATGDHVNQGRVHPQANDYLLFDPIAATDPAVRIVDGTCEDAVGARKRYRSVVQSFRMHDCAGKPTFKDRRKIWSHAAVGVDGSGRALFVFARSPWSTGAFVEILQALPIDLERVQYGEGGPESTLFVRAGGTELELFGSYETDFVENDDNDRAWALPNVLGVRRRAPNP